MNTTADAGAIVCGALGPRISDLAARIAAADAFPQLVSLAPQVRDIGSGLLADDVGAGLASRVIGALNDRLSVRVVTLVAAAHRLPAATWCWLAFGSEGRGERTLVTDQDNGIIFSAADAAEAQAMRQLFQPFGHAANEALAACGVPLCTGGIMAGNPAWCLSLDEWRRHFSSWIRSPDPTALLNATIFFDFRCVYGDAGLAEQLRRYLLGLSAANDAFTRMMATNALSVAPPLGLFGDVVDAPGDAGGIYLKLLGARLFVDAARIFALAAGLAPVGTVARLHAAATQGGLDKTLAAAAAQAFSSIQYLRFCAQADALATSRPVGNCVSSKDLNEFEHRLLKAALKQAQQVQQHMKRHFRLDA